MISYFRGLTLTVSIYSSSTCLVVLVLITLFERGGTTKHITKTSELNERDFIIRNIYKDLY